VVGWPRWSACLVSDQETGSRINLLKNKKLNRVRVSSVFVEGNRVQFTVVSWTRLTAVLIRLE
jgi:hypothetical protein